MAHGAELMSIRMCGESQEVDASLKHVKAAVLLLDCDPSESLGASLHLEGDAVLWFESLPHKQVDGDLGAALRQTFQLHHYQCNTDRRLCSLHAGRGKLAPVC